MSKTKSPIIIIGAGLTGLATAWRLSEANYPVQVLEADTQSGGRIKSLFAADGSVLGDLGPTWVWPEFQPVIRRWLAALDLPTFAQFDDGATIVDNGPKRSHNVVSFPVSMAAGAYSAVLAQ